jgi:hypothetical protein
MVMSSFTFPFHLTPPASVLEEQPAPGAVFIYSRKESWDLVYESYKSFIAYFRYGLKCLLADFVQPESRMYLGWLEAMRRYKFNTVAKPDELSDSLVAFFAKPKNCVSWFTRHGNDEGKWLAVHVRTPGIAKKTNNRRLLAIMNHVIAGKEISAAQMNTKDCATQMQLCFQALVDDVSAEARSGIACQLAAALQTYKEKGYTAFYGKVDELAFRLPNPMNDYAKAWSVHMNSARGTSIADCVGGGEKGGRFGRRGKARNDGVAAAANVASKAPLAGTKKLDASATKKKMQAGAKKSTRPAAKKKPPLANMQVAAAAKAAKKKSAAATESVAAVFNLDQLRTGGNGGLVNLGNTCYMNAVIKCVAHSPEFQEAMFGGDYAAFALTSTVKSSFVELMKVTMTGERGSEFNPQRFFDAFCFEIARYTDHEQEDATEFLRDLFSVIANAASLSVVDEIPFISGIYSWKKVISRKCDVCQGLCGLSQQVSNLVEVALPVAHPQRESKRFKATASSAAIGEEYSLLHLLRSKFFDNGPVQGDCVACALTLTACTQVVSFKQLPPLLVIVLLRFETGRKRNGSFTSRKVDTAISYPLENLDLSCLVVFQVLVK